MRRLSMILVATAILTPLVGSALEGQLIPEVLYSSDPGVQGPVWVNAAWAINPGGIINEKLFLAPLRGTIESYFAEAPTGDCYIVEESFEARVDPPDRSSLDRAVRHSGFVFLGRVTEVAYGFHFSIPGKLLRIKPSQVLQGKAFLDAYYIFFPAGEFYAGPYRICKSDSRYPRPPYVGEELLIMVPDTRARTSFDPYLELEEASSVVVIPEAGEPDLPKVFKDSAGEKSTPAFQSKAELVAAMRKALGKKEVKP